MRSATAHSRGRAAIEANPRARKTFQTLGRQNLFSLAFLTNNMKTPPAAPENCGAGSDAGARRNHRAGSALSR
jgi:hypothetical protein